MLHAVNTRIPFKKIGFIKNKWELEVNSFIGLHSAKRDYTMTKNNDDCTAEV